MYTADTIAAIATPEGTGALGIVRLTGPRSWETAASITADPQRFMTFPPREAQLVRLLDAGGHLLDEAVILPWRSPSSYTGEDMVEFTCHGGREVLRAVLHSIITAGARPAEPGEFTQRAFLNGKISLDQTEAVAALIEARTETAVRVAARILSGKLKGKVESLRQRLLETLARVELDLDFVEEELEEEAARVTISSLQGLSDELSELLKQFQAGKYLRYGVNVIIAGPPNVGKSTLLNRLVGYDRAIVTKTPGTTRDYIDVTLDWNGLPVRLYDTAGLRETQDAIEKEGALRTRELYDNADTILWLSSPPDYTPPPHELVRSGHLLHVENKCDIANNEQRPKEYPDKLLRISALTGEGVRRMREELVDGLLRGVDPGAVILAEQRHADLIEEALESLQSAGEAMCRDLGLELVATDLRSALNSIGLITGAIASEELLHEIFSRFCIGK